MICKDCIIDPICKIGCDKLDNMTLKDFKNNRLIERLLNRKKEAIFNFEGTIVKIEKNSCYFYNLSDKLHREDGPAIEFVNGEKHWYIDGELHREDGPAVEYASGDKYWYKNGKLHRVDGPPITKNR